MSAVWLSMRHKLTLSVNCWRIRLKKHSSSERRHSRPKNTFQVARKTGAWPKLKRTWRSIVFVLQCFPMAHLHLHPLTSQFFPWKYPCRCRQGIVSSTLQLPALAPSLVIQPVPQSQAKTKSKPNSKSCCPYRCSHDHLNYCEEFKKLNNDEIATWLKSGDSVINARSLLSTLEKFVI